MFFSPTRSRTLKEVKCCIKKHQVRILLGHRYLGSPLPSPPPLVKLTILLAPGLSWSLLVALLDSVGIMCSQPLSVL